jgi:ribosomal protein S18 acetylase RimI-like enzyme
MRDEPSLVESFSLQPDAWLSMVLDRPAWRVEAGTAGQGLPMLLDNRSQFAFAKLSVAEVPSVWAFCAYGFRIVDVALTFDAAPACVGSCNDQVRFADPGDLTAVKALAGSAFCYSRFHMDPLVPNSAADTIKMEWATNFFSGRRGDGMVVALVNDRVVGFLQLLWATLDCLVIDLIAVEPASQGRGIAKGMIEFAFRHGTGDEQKASTMKVGTQAANVPSIRLYESMGFRLCEAQYVLHYHGAKV